MPTAIALFQELPIQERLELLNMGTQACFRPGELLFQQGEPAQHFYIVLNGAIRVSRRINNQEFVLDTYEKDAFFGETALLGAMIYPFSGLAVGNSCVYFFDKDSFWQMLALFPSIRRVVLNCVSQRTQELQHLSQTHQKFMALATLAAGLAHELNNPASAAYRAVSQLQETMSKRYTLLLKYMEQTLTPQQMQVLVRLKQNACTYASQSDCLNFSLDPLTQIELEDQLVAWLEAREIDNGWRLASSLLAAGITPEQLADISERTTTETFRDLLTLLERMITEASLLNILDNSVVRVTELVSAVKTYSHLDRSFSKKDSLDICQGLESTLTILSYKLKQHQIKVKREYASELPLIYGNGAALNQVWSHLIENAIDAIEQQGTIWIRTSATDDCALVEIADSGAGIPLEIQDRIFEPFFTTKGVGKGTGIGLNFVFRVVVCDHHGDVRCCSEPGYTRFRVYLPIGG
ncbi:MAG: ATP-binding protein [Cyanophyceae cyanobacterium]